MDGRRLIGHALSDRIRPEWAKRARLLVGSTVGVLVAGFVMPVWTHSVAIIVLGPARQSAIEAMADMGQPLPFDGPLTRGVLIIATVVLVTTPLFLALSGCAMYCIARPRRWVVCAFAGLGLVVTNFGVYATADWFSMAWVSVAPVWSAIGGFEMHRYQLRRLSLPPRPG